MKTTLLLISACWMFIATAQDDLLLTSPDGSINIRDFEIASDQSKYLGVDFNSTTLDALLHKIDANGATEYSKRFQFFGTSASCTYDVIEKSNGNIYVHGLLMETFTDAPNAFLVELTPTGTVIFAKKYLLTEGFNSTYYINRMIVNEDGSILLNCSMFDKAVLLKLSEDGTLQWGRTIQNEQGEIGKNPSFDARILPDGSIIGCGKDEDSLSLYKFDSNGSIQWAKTMRVGNYIRGKALEHDANGNLYINAHFTEYDTTLQQTHNNSGLLKIDGNTGTLIWAKKFNEITSNIWSLANDDLFWYDGHLHASFMAVDSLSYPRHYLVKMSPEGEILESFKSKDSFINDWSDYNSYTIRNGEHFVYGANYNYIQNFYAVGFLRSGSTTWDLNCYFHPMEFTFSNYTNHGSMNDKVFSIESYGSEETVGLTLENVTLTTQSYCQLLSLPDTPLEEVLVYPNPSNGQVTFRADNSGTVRIYNNLGALVLESKLEEGVNYLELPATSGSYHYIFETASSVQNGKLQVVR